MEPKLTNTASLKTYSRSKCWKVSNPKDTKCEPLTTKEAVQYLLQGSLKRRVCRFCLTTTTSLSELDEILEVASSGVIFQVAVRDMLASFYPFQISDDPNFPNKICGKCLDRTINCYLFTQQCERAERAIRNCFIDVNEKFDKLDPLERVKRRGRQKLNPNHNIIHIEHKNVINYADPIIHIINSGSSLVNSNVVQINELECPKCWQVFTNVEALVNHEKIHPKSMWYNCKYCGNSFVKLSHYKKHIKQSHVKENTKTNEDKQHFECKECDTVFEELDNYLQHIEKHKFKNVLEHLVEKKMDNLCGVCLDKGDSMTQLNETLSLHGGYPELSGELTVATVLTSTIPEKSHKFDEFLVSKQANRIAITRRIAKTDKRATKQHDEINKITNAPDVAMKLITITHDTYRFSNPLKITTEIIDVDETNSSMFEKTKSVDIPSLHIGIKDGAGFPFSFAKPIKISDNVDVKDKEQQIDMPSIDIRQAECIEIEPNSGISTAPILCMTCSILKKGQCEKCIENTSDNNVSTSNVENENTQMMPCKKCWIFGKVGKCNYCNEQIDDKTVEKDVPDPQESEKADPMPKVNVEPKKSMEIPKSIDDENIPNQQNLKPDKSTLNLEINDEPEKDNPIRKRKIESEEIVISKKTIGHENVILDQHVEPEEIVHFDDRTKINLETKGIITRKRKIEPKEILNEKANTEDGEPIPSRKRKIDHEIELPIVKRSKWQCEICLTNNDNRERCFCCGEKRMQDNVNNFSFNFTKCEYTPKRNKNKSDAVKNNNLIITTNKEENENTEQVIKDDKEEQNKVEVVKNDLIPNITLPNLEVVANVVKVDTNQIKTQNEEQMEINFDDGHVAKVAGNVAKFDVNIAQFGGNNSKFDTSIPKVDGSVAKFDSIIGNFGKIDSNVIKPVMPSVNFNFGSCSTFTPAMQSFTPPVMQNFNPISTMSPTQLTSLSFNIGTQDSNNKPRKILKNMRHRREKQLKR